MQAQDVERIARVALRELGAGNESVSVVVVGPDSFQVTLGGHPPATLTVRAGAGTTAQYIRQQIFDQFRAG